MSVYDIRDLFVGGVTEIRACCFLTADPRDRKAYSLTQDAVFTVTDRVTLVCNLDDCTRYACAVHSQALPPV